MNPRLKSSKKWTTFPKEYLSQIEEVFSQGFKEKLQGSKLIVEGRIYTEEIVLRVGVLEKGRIRQANFEVSCQFSPKEKDAVDRIYDCIDAAASMMAEYFESDGEAEFPFVWKEYEFNGRALFLQHSTVNTSLEAEADALLGETDSDLVVEEVTDETEDALDRAVESLEVDDNDDNIDYEEDEDEDSESEEGESKGPSMFSGKSKKKKEDLH